jgi:hypothetical protein
MATSDGRMEYAERWPTGSQVTRRAEVLYKTQARRKGQLSGVSTRCEGEMYVVIDHNSR